MAHKEGYETEHQHYDKTNGHVGIADGIEVVGTDNLLGRIRQLTEVGHPIGRLHGSIITLKIGQYHLTGYDHTRERPHGVEGLGQVEATGGCLRTTQCHDERVGRGFKESQTKGKDVQGETEEGKILVQGSRNEEESTHGIEPQADEDAHLITIAADEESRRNGHRGITTIEGELHKSSLEITDLECRLESRHHGIRDVVGKAPEGEQRGDEDKGQKVALLYKFVCHWV